MQPVAAMPGAPAPAYMQGPAAVNPMQQLQAPAQAQDPHAQPPGPGQVLGPEGEEMYIPPDHPYAMQWAAFLLKEKEKKKAAQPAQPAQGQHFQGTGVPQSPAQQ